MGFAQPIIWILALGPKSDTPHPFVVPSGINPNGEAYPVFPEKSNWAESYEAPPESIDTGTSLLFLTNAEVSGLDYRLKFDPIKITWNPKLLNTVLTADYGLEVRIFKVNWVLAAFIVTF